MTAGPLDVISVAEYIDKELGLYIYEHKDIFLNQDKR